MIRFSAQHIIHYFKLDEMLEIMEPHSLDVALLIYHTWTCVQSNGDIASQIIETKRLSKLFDVLSKRDETTEKSFCATKEASTPEVNFIKFCEHRISKNPELSNHDSVIYNLINYSRLGDRAYIECAYKRIMYIINDAVCEWSRNNTDMI